MTLRGWGLRWWYLRRGMAWRPILGGGALALALMAAWQVWPSSAVALLPVALTCGVAAAAFVFDEPLLGVAAVTPRGAGWRRSTRLAATIVPLVAWVPVVWLVPEATAAHRADWWLVGAAALALAVGLAALLSRGGIAAPGTLLASGVAVAMLAPLAVGSMLGLPLLYPYVDLTAGAWTVWGVVAAAGVLTLGAGMAPGVGDGRTSRM